MQKLLSFLCFVGISCFSFSQEVTANLTEVTSPLADIEGTFQVILKHEDMLQPEITPGIKSLIVDARDQNEVKFIHLDAYTVIRVLSVAQIEATDFEPVTLYVYEK